MSSENVTSGARGESLRAEVRERRGMLVQGATASLGLRSAQGVLAGVGHGDVLAVIAIRHDGARRVSRGDVDQYIARGHAAPQLRSVGRAG